MIAKTPEIFPTVSPNHMVKIDVKMAITPIIIKRIPTLFPSLSLFTGCHVSLKPARNANACFVRTI